MDSPDNKHKLLELFASLVEVHKPDPELTLTTPIKDLQDGRDQATALFEGVVRPNPDALNTQAVGQQRFPDLQGSVELFAQGLDKHKDLVEEILAGPEIFTAAIAVDQAIGRLIYTGELLVRGGHAGEVLAGAAAQKVCEDTLDQARARIGDQQLSPATQSDISLAFEEPFRIQEDQRQRLLQAQAIDSKGAQPYHAQVDQATGDALLAGWVDAYMTSVLQKGQ